MPTATDRDFLDMRVSDVRRIAHAGQGQDHYVVLLQETGSDRRLPIWIGHEHALELALRLLGHSSQLPRPLSIVVDGPHGATEVDARPSDALALALVVGASIRADRAVVETTESDETVAEALATIDSQRAAGPQAILDELSEEAQRQDPPEPASS